MHMLEQNKGQDHVSAQDQAFENMSLHGSDVYLCSEYGNQLKLTMTSANQLSIDTGALLVNGRYCIIDPAETLSVDNGSSGMTEYDLVCVHWKVTSGTGTNQQEEVDLAIVKGTPASSGAMDPTITNKVIKPGTTEAYVPFARITKNGLTPSVELIVPTMVPEAEFRDSISPVVLHNNPDQPINSDIELADDTSNYSKLTIEFKDSDGYYSSIEISDPNGKSVCLSTIRYSEEGWFGVNNRVVKISGTSISTVRSSGNFGNTGQINILSSRALHIDVITITKVIGWK